MINREQISGAVQASLRMSPEQAAQVHIKRISDGWELRAGYWPFIDDHARAVLETTSHVEQQVIRRNLGHTAFEIDACSIGYESLYQPPQPVERIIGGVGLWFLSSQQG